MTFLPTQYIPFRKQDLVKFRFKVQGCKNPSLPQIRRLKDDATFGIMYLSSTVFKLSFRKAITNLLFEFPFSSVPFLSITQTSTIPPLTKHLSPYLRNSLRQWGTDTVLSIWAGRLRYVLWLWYWYYTEVLYPVLLIGYLVWYHDIINIGKIYAVTFSKPNWFDFIADFLSFVPEI